MLTPAARRLTLVVLSLTGAMLACVRAEVPITPATPLAASPEVVAQVSPTAAASQDQSPTPELPTATVEASPTPEVTAPVEPTDTPVVAPPPTDTPLPATDTPLPTETPITPPATDTPGPTETPSPVPTVGSNPAGIPENATFTQQFTVSNEGGTVIGRPSDMADGRTETWASLRGGDASWILDLGSPQNVIGLRVWAQPDGGEETTLRIIEVSADGANWSPVYVGDGTCGDVPQCDFLVQREFVDFGFGPLTIQFIRMHGGPTRFAFAEVKVALAP